MLAVFIISTLSIVKFLSVIDIVRPEMLLCVQPIMFTTQNATSFAKEINLEEIFIRCIKSLGTFSKNQK